MRTTAARRRSVDAVFTGFGANQLPPVLPASSSCGVGHGRVAQLTRRELPNVVDGRQGRRLTRPAMEGDRGAKNLVRSVGGGLPRGWLRRNEHARGPGGARLAQSGAAGPTAQAPRSRPAGRDKHDWRRSPDRRRRSRRQQQTDRRGQGRTRPSGRIDPISLALRRPAADRRSSTSRWPR